MSLPQEFLFEKSAEVFEDCALPSGAIIAANSSLPEYPETSENYAFSWARDVAWQLIGAHYLAEEGFMPSANDIRSSYLNWLLERCDGGRFTQTGLLIKRYHPNGPRDIRYGNEYQPDQAGLLAWAIDQTTLDQDQRAEHVMRLLANGLSSMWQGSHFKRPIQDLWENQLAKPENDEVFTYSLAMSALGLAAAIRRLENQDLDNERSRWEETLYSMLIKLSSETRATWFKRIGGSDSSLDSTVDASLLGLVYPFVGADSKPWTIKRRATADLVEDELHIEGCGVIRYHGDTYDGIVREGGEEAIAGTWPLLGFWNAIAQSKLGNKTEARFLYNMELSRLNNLWQEVDGIDGLIPEQTFLDPNLQGNGVLPLAWSHVMYVIATCELDVS